MGRVKTLPNFLTLLRILALPFVVVSIIGGHFKLALALFLLCAFTDFLDGFLARRFKSVSSLGILLDPVADKLLTSSTLISLAYVKLCDPYSVVVLVGREEAVTGMRAIAASRGLLIPASAGGKLKTVLIMAAVTLLLFGYRKLGEVTLLGAVTVSLITAAHYFYNFWKLLGDRQ